MASVGIPNTIKLDGTAIVRYRYRVIFRDRIERVPLEKKKRTRD